MTAGRALRIASLVPSASETLTAWGIEPVAVTRFCDPVDGAAVVGGTKDPDIAQLVGLACDLVVVCDEENRLVDAEALTAAGIPIHNISIRSVADVAPALSSLAAAVGVPSPAPVEPGLRSPLAGTAFVPIWRRPWMSLAADTYGSSMLEWLGLANVFGESGTRYPEVTVDEIQRRRPDWVIAPDEPYPFSERHRRELEALGRVLFVDGRDLFWWGVRTPAAIERLRAQLHA